MRQAIHTKYVCPTNTKGGKCRAVCEAGRMVVEWDDALDVPNNHALAARRLCAKLGWDPSTFIGGDDPRGGYVFVNVKFEKPITEVQ